MAGLCFLMLSTISWGLKDSGMCCVEGGEGGNGGGAKREGEERLLQVPQYQNYSGVTNSQTAIKTYSTPLR